MTTHPTFKDILYYGTLEKRRDGAVRGGWAIRTFVLTKVSLNYFRRVTDQALLGEERDQISLMDITSILVLSADKVPQGIVELGKDHHYLYIRTQERSILMRVPLADAVTCENWSKVIKEQQYRLEANVSLSNNIRSIHDDDSRNIRSLPSIIVPQIICITGTSNSNQVHHNRQIPSEWIILNQRLVAWGESIDLGILTEGGACILTLQDNGSARIGTQALMGSWDAGESIWLDMTTPSNVVKEIKVSAKCTVLPQGSSYSTRLENTMNDHDDETMTSDLASSNSEWTRIGSRVENVLAGMSLGCSLLLHFFYGVDQLYLSHKMCLTVGVAMAMVNLFGGMTTTLESASTRPKSSGDPLSVASPQLQFSLTIIGCRIEHDGKQVEYPYPPPPSS